MKCELIAIGTEILLGDIVNTNAQYLSKALADLGVDVYHQSVVGDNEERILNSFRDGFNRAELIVTTGGLGPTQDDITKEVAAKYFDKELVFHEESWIEIEKYFNSVGKEIKGNNKKQAYHPEGAMILKNKYGTAPGIIIEDGNRKMIILPGPPKEMKNMFEEYAIPYIKKLSDTTIKSKTLRILGLSESLVAEEVKDIIENGVNPTVAPYAKEFDVALRITAKANSELECSTLINPVIDKIKEKLQDNIYGEDDINIEQIVGELITRNNLTIATAESCTGGMVAAKLISYAGISSVFLEGAVTYSNEAKMKRLGVGRETLETYGAVSEQTAKEMALGIARESGAQIGIATTGIAGPGGGTEEKPVGLVYIAVSIKGEVVVKKCNFNGDREKVRVRSTVNALDLLRRELLKRKYS